MRLKDYSTEQIVRHCLQQKKEGDYWDFKQEWHEKTADLLKDIICFANTVHDEKCYIIFGISDTFEKVGMSQSRRKQADIIDTISSLNFAGGIYPQITVETIDVDKIILDVLIIDNVEKTPVFLEKDWGNMKHGCIYARAEDRNTPDNGNADIDVIEMLWRKRLGLTKTPYEYIMDRLQNPQEWSEYGQDLYNIYKPELRLHKSEEIVDGRAEFYAYTQDNSDVWYSSLNIIANNTILDSYRIVHLDSGQLNIPTPEWDHLSRDRWSREHYLYKYYIANSDRYRLLDFLVGSKSLEEQMAYDALMKVILIYDSKEEKNEF